MLLGRFTFKISNSGNSLKIFSPDSLNGRFQKKKLIVTKSVHACNFNLCKYVSKIGRTKLHLLYYSNKFSSGVHAMHCAKLLALINENQSRPRQ